MVMGRRVVLSLTESSILAQCTIEVLVFAAVCCLLSLHNDDANDDANVTCVLHRW